MAELLSEADVVFVNGLQLEEPTKELAEANLKDGAEIVELGTRDAPRGRAGSTTSRSPRRTASPTPTSGPTRRWPAATPSSSRDVMVRRDPGQRRLLPGQLRGVLRQDRRARRRDAHAFATVPQPRAAHLPRRLRLLRPRLRLGRDRRHPGVATSRTRRRARWPTSSSRCGRERVPAIFGSEVFPSPVLEQIAQRDRRRVRRRPPRRRPAGRARRPGPLVARLMRVRLHHDDRGPRRRRVRRCTTSPCATSPPTRRTTRSERPPTTWSGSEGASCTYGGDAGPARRRPRHRAGTVHRHRRAVRSRQDHPAAGAGRDDAAGRRHGACAGPASASATCRRWRRSTGRSRSPCPSACSWPAPPRRRRPWPTRAERADAAAVLDRLGLDRARRPPHPGAVRRPAAADVHRPGAARRPGPAAHGRADVGRRPAPPATRCCTSCPTSTARAWRWW